MNTLASTPADRVREQVRTGAEAIKGQIQETGRTIGKHVRAVGAAASEEITAVVGPKVDAVRAGAARLDHVRSGMAENPGTWVCAAAAIGFLTGVVMCRRSNGSRAA